MSVAHGVVLCRLAILALFTASAVGKLSSRRDFELAVAGFGLLRGHRAVSTTAIAVIAAEVLVVGMTGVGGRLLVPGFVLAVALLIAFSLALGHAVVRGIDVRCNCFGPGVRRVSPFDLVRNAVMIGCGIAGAVLGQVHHEPVTGGEFVLLAAMSVVLVVATTNVRDIVTTVRKPL